MAVFGGGFVGFIVVSVLVIHLLKPKAQKASIPAHFNTVQEAPSAKTAAAHIATPVPAAPAAVAPATVGPDIVSVQLESTQSALRQAKEDAQSLENKLTKALASRDETAAKQAQLLITRIESLDKRIRALEEDRMLNPGVSVVFSDTGRPVKTVDSVPEHTNAPYTPPKGFVVRAELGNRVWLSDGQREISILKTDAPPKPGPVAQTQSIRTTNTPMISSASNQ
ncbi:hypothetical protein BAU07_26185 (plasmid) [Bordetella flabilis]|uniref:Uncharacterized protein n=2 Tax=Bordetella flabilis TaxID=463014 RepID=A0A193GN72_9BORD|nr:hypothetical protein BAU07_26185 [Bordetella flabilis]